MNKCDRCKEETKRLATKHPKLCMKCYKKEHPALKRVCEKCGQLQYVSQKNPICQKCKGYVRPKAKCSVCDNLKSVAYRNNNRSFCRTCYNKLYRPQRVCIKCGETKIINCNNLCKKCYQTNKDVCSMCGRCLPVHKRVGTQLICKNCYNSWRITNDENFAILVRLRSRLRDAFKSYSKTGKVRKADEYGVNYKAIIDMLGPCPGKLENYHIDHIKPLSLFNFEDVSQIRQAFAPENHQWLTKKENLKKSNKYGDLDGNI